eukprot:gb/GFBE01074882.1/.p1 GENE.gb/GFBE01074882.1/~~gb/GFBE01074882.1/.p1  ORF type:complete len:296 (+),score=51.37 gb/GFBE01074882.1/:1-888(+)
MAKTKQVEAKAAERVEATEATEATQEDEKTEEAGAAQTACTTDGVFAAAAGITSPEDGTGGANMRRRGKSPAMKQHEVQTPAQPESNSVKPPSSTHRRQTWQNLARLGALLGAACAIATAGLYSCGVSPSAAAKIANSWMQRQSVCIYVQRSSIHGQNSYGVPEDMSPQQLVDFVASSTWAGLKYRWCSSSEDLSLRKVVYVTTSSASRWDETLFDPHQLNEIGADRIDAFLFVRVAPPELCADDEEPRDVQEYVSERFPSRSIAFAWICFWEGDILRSSAFVKQSLRELDLALL